MMIYLAADHAGFEMKLMLLEHLVHHGNEVEDLGPNTLDKEDDYPNYAFKVTTKVLGSSDEDPRGILLCGSGQGMAMAANRVAGIRAAIAWDEDIAKLSREHEDTNILTLPSRFISSEEAFKITDVWLKTKFSKAPRHQRRLDEIESLYG
ncbi:MAG: RpiB/LacA/LacB family sugar-phosphate isomerase [Candidatus Saccharimonadales bacterium]